MSHGLTLATLGAPELTILALNAAILGAVLYVGWRLLRRYGGRDHGRVAELESRVADLEAELDDADE
jgi:hypothetical protein